MKALADFLAVSGITQRDFADKAGLHESYLCRLLRGKHKQMGVGAAKKISAATGGAVSVLDLLGVDPSGERDAAPEHPATPSTK